MSDKKKKGLGRGLSALFGDQKNVEQIIETQETQESQKVALIGDLNRNRYQPRLHFDEKKLSDLSESIKKKWCNSTNCSQRR